MLMEAAGDGGGGGGKPPAENPDLAAIKAENAALIKRLEALEKGGGKPAETPEQKSLEEKAKLEREAKEKKTADSKSLESAIRFTMGAKDWVKTNESLLPKTISGIFEQAEKENFADAVEKDSAIKAGIISEFFSVQANLDLLTPGLKSVLEDFTKLTKNVKQERAQQVYDQVFEPAFEMLKRVKKAELLSKGLSSPTDSEAAYKEKLIKGSRKHFMREK